MLRIERFYNKQGKLDYKYFENDVEITKEEYDVKLQAEIEDNKFKAKVAKFRKHRADAFRAFDAYKASVVYNGEIESEDVRNEILNWYQTMKDFPQLITPATTVEDYPATPEPIKYYLKKIKIKKGF